MLRQPKDKRELIRHLQDLPRDFKIVAIGWGKKADVLEEVRKLSPAKDVAAIIIEIR